MSELELIFHMCSEKYEKFINNKSIMMLFVVFDTLNVMF
jgi:hypothetical protein